MKLKNISKRNNPRTRTNKHNDFEIAPLPSHFAMAVFDESTGKMMEMRELLHHPDPTVRKELETSVANEFGRLLKGIGKETNNGKSRVGDGHDTFHFIHKSQVPKNKKVTYARFCCDVRPQKEEKNFTRITVGGNRLDYDGDTSTEVSSMETFKIHINSVISTKGVRYVCADVGNFYTNSRLESPEYVRIRKRDIPQEVKNEYDVKQYIAEDGYVYCEITGAMYGLKAAGYIANKDLEKHLAP